MAPPLLGALLVLSFALARPQGSSAEALSSLLPPGPFPVGFRSSWALDDGRTYRTAFDEGRTYGAEKAPRPLLVLQWYPAEPRAVEVAPMAHGDYLSIASEDPRLAQLAEALRAFARDVFVQQVMGEPEDALDDAERAELERTLAAPTPCRRGVEPARGPFPVVLYHSGAGSSFEDNAALCAHLASHGFVVLGGAFQEADGSSLAVDAGRGSAEDFQFLARWARALPHADWRHLALAGHSAGAQAILKYAAQPGCVAEALVLLDTTQDYYGLALPLHESLVREASEGRELLTRPMLVATGPEALFELLDSLAHAERTYLTVPGLGHDEFISQGLQRLERITRRPSSPEENAELARIPRVIGHYRILCETVRAFLDANLGRSGAHFRARVERDRTLPWTHEAPRLVRVPRGVDAPEPYDPTSDHPPTPRQYRRLFHEQGTEAACAVLLRFRDREPRGPLHTSTMLSGSLLYELASSGKREEAASYYSALQEIDLPVLSLFEFLADLSEMQKERGQALHFLRIAHDLAPDDADLLERLGRLDDAGK